MCLLVTKREERGVQQYSKDQKKQGKYHDDEYMRCGASHSMRGLPAVDVQGSKWITRSISSLTAEAPGVTTKTRPEGLKKTVRNCASKKMLFKLLTAAIKWRTLE